MYVYRQPDLRIPETIPETPPTPYVPAHIRTNHPTKIADRFTNLFDIEWADAYEQVCRNRQGVPEVMIIIDLADILKVCK